MALDVAPVHALWALANTILRHLKTQAAVGNLAHTAAAVTPAVCAEMDEQWVMSEANHASAGCFTRGRQDTEDGCGARIR